MPRKRNEQQELQNEQEEFDVNESSSLNAASDETTAPSNENEVLLVNQTYLTEETLPGEYRENTHEQVAEERDEDLNEEENSEEYEYEEESETEYEEEDEAGYEEEGELDEESEYEESEDAEAGEPVRSKIGLVIDRVMASVKDADGNIDKAQIAKYAGVAVLAIYGLSRKSMLGKILISGVVSLLAKQLLNGNAAKQGGETDENEAVAA